MEDLSVVLTTCPDKGSAEAIAEVLVEARIAACVSILPGISSVYRWEGQIENSEEVLLLIKSKQTSFNKLKELISSRHPYECPEILSVQISDIAEPYALWMKDVMD